MDFKLFAAFLISCAVITICFTKKQMKKARAIFWAMGIYVGFSSAAMMLIGSRLADVIYTDDFLLVAKFLLLFYTVASVLISLIIGVASLILLVFAIKKVAELLRGEPKNSERVTDFCQRVFNEKFFVIRKLFILHCRLLN